MFARRYVRSAGCCAACQRQRSMLADCYTPGTAQQRHAAALPPFWWCGSCGPCCLSAWRCFLCWLRCVGHLPHSLTLSSHSTRTHCICQTARITLRRGLSCYPELTVLRALSVVCLCCAVSAYVTHGVFPRESWKKFKADNGGEAEADSWQHSSCTGIQRSSIA
jgi:hypothetical protein